MKVVKNGDEGCGDGCDGEMGMEVERDGEEVILEMRDKGEGMVGELVRLVEGVMDCGDIGLKVCGC